MTMLTAIGLVIHPTRLPDETTLEIRFNLRSCDLRNWEQLTRIYCVLRNNQVNKEQMIEILQQLLNDLKSDRAN